jgi:hypothetical protein
MVFARTGYWRPTPEASTDVVKASTSPLIMSDKLKRNGTFMSNGSFFSGSPDGSVTCDVWYPVEALSGSSLEADRPGAVTITSRPAKVVDAAQASSA